MSESDSDFKDNDPTDHSRIPDANQSLSGSTSCGLNHKEWQKSQKETGDVFCRVESLIGIELLNEDFATLFAWE